VRTGIEQHLVDAELLCLVHAPGVHLLASDPVLEHVRGLKYPDLPAGAGERVRQRGARDPPADDDDVC
jgi:hypothetical protein